MGVDVPVHAYDCAHRIGKRKQTEKYVDLHFMIVRFTSCRERSNVYRARKNGNENLVISLDIARPRQTLLNKVRDDLVAKYANAEFAFNDINCNLVIKFGGRGGFRQFASWEDAKDLCSKFGGETEDGEEFESESDDDTESPDA